MNMSFALTTAQILDESKTVTRRLGPRAKTLTPGQTFWAIEKGMGLQKGERVRRLKQLRVADVRQEPLTALLTDDAYGRRECAREGFPHLSPAEFVAMFCRTHKGCTPDTVVSRIAFTYVSELPR